MHMHTHTHACTHTHTLSHPHRYYPIYPEGLYKCIQRSSRYGIPMYVTETGIADSRDDRCVHQPGEGGREEALALPRGGGGCRLAA